jgi:protein involved in polysaccharide export with SLBB domain
MLAIVGIDSSAQQIPGQLQQLIPGQFMEQLGVGAQQQGLIPQPLDFPQVVNPPPQEPIPEDELPGAIPRLESGDTVIIEFTLRAEDYLPERVESQFVAQVSPGVLPTQAPQAIEPNPVVAPGEIPEPDAAQTVILERLIAGNPYQLNGDGFVDLPGVPPIQLAGLTVEEAMVRVRAEPSLVWLQPLITLLPIEPFGLDSLELFGYDIFSGIPTTFAPATDVPVPSEYVMGPGDSVRVFLFGNSNVQYHLRVLREGFLNFPEIGPISVAGLSFEDMRTILEQRIEEQMIGVRSSITLGELRSIRVFVLGEVEQPGSYTVSGLSTMTHALLVSGGLNEISSLRQIQLRRGGQTISTLDLYDLLLEGDTSADQRLQPGDVIFSPPRGDSVAIYGEVRRPAVYELNGEQDIESVLALAGGFGSDADLSKVKLERISPSGTAVYNIDLYSGTSEIESLQNGDVLLVQSRLEQLDNAVRLSGNVFQPGIFQWKEGLRLTDLIVSREQIRPGSDLAYVLVRREIEPNVHTEVFSADLQNAWDDPMGKHNVLLHSRDSVYVFDRVSSRLEIVSQLLEELRAQRFGNEEFPVVSIGGQVNAPGDYPLEADMTIEDIVRAGGGLNESAHNLDAELLRYSTNDDGVMQAQVINVNLDDIRQGSTGANINLRPQDYLNIKVVPNWGEEEVVEIQGEVTFPGVYPLIQGETLTELLSRAGGLTQYAFPNGVIFIREELQEREGEQLENLANRLEADVQALAADPLNAGAVVAGNAVVARLRNTAPVGRLVLDFQSIVDGTGMTNIVLRENDQLFVPPVPQEVTVLGEVQYPTSHIYEPGLGRDAYVEMSGGTTDNADDGRVYTVRANGSVETGGSRWFARGGDAEIGPGDTIIVPVETETPLLPTIASTTQVLYNVAIAAAAIASF